jgi:hypothetical protein
MCLATMALGNAIGGRTGAVMGGVLGGGIPGLLAASKLYPKKKTPAAPVLGGS